eukprot:139_1
MSEAYYDDGHAHKRRKTGNNSYVDVPADIEAEDDEDHDEEEQQAIEEADLDGFIAPEDDIMAEQEAERRRKRKRRRKKKKKRHRNAPITEDTLRMLAEQRGQKFKPDIDIGQGLSDDSQSEDDSDDSDEGGTQRRVLKKRVMEFDEESVMGHNMDDNDDDFHDYGDHQSVTNSLYQTTNQRDANHNNRNHNNRNDRDRRDDDFVVNDMNQTGRYANYYENDQIDKLYTIFGNNIYSFLGIPHHELMEEDLGEEKDEHLIELEAQRKAEEAHKSEQKLKDFKRGLEGLDPKQKQRVMEIINTDIPERLQERIEKTDDEQITEIALNKEAQWISSQPYFMKLRALNRPISNEVIIIFLKYFRINHYDVPYIFTYLRDEYPLDIERQDIWKMDELDDKYQQIYLRKRNIEIYLQQIEDKLTENKDDEEAMRWMDRVEEAKMFLYDASTHHELEAVDMFLNIVPTTSASAILITNNDKQNGKEEEQYPDPPRDLVCTDALDWVDRYGPLKSDRSELQSVLDEVNNKLLSNPCAAELRQMQLETDELTKLKEFYTECMNDIDSAADKEIDSEEFQGDEAFQFFGCSQTDLEELDDSISRITDRIAQLETEKQRIEDEYEIEKTDFEALRVYYAKCIEIMPAIRKTKKAASIVRNGKNTYSGRGGRGAFKLSVSDAILPLCRNIGFSKIVSDNVKNCGQLHGGIRPDLLQNIVVEQSELNEICEEICNAQNEGEIHSKYATRDDVITESVYHLARHIGHEPVIRRWVLQEIEEHGVISTQPTLKGRDLIEWTDELACVKRLSDKPIARFLSTNDTPQEGMNKEEAKLHWLLIHKGTKQGLLRNHISIAHETVRDMQQIQFGDVIEEHYYNASSTIKFFLYKLGPMYIAETSKAEYKLLKLRILHDALNLYLVPWAVKWVGHKMLEHDEARVISDACTELKFLANVAGERDNLKSTKNILSIIVGEENSPSFLVLLNHFGDVIDETMLHYMKTKIRLNPQFNNNNAEGNKQHNTAIVSTHDRLQLEKKNGDLKLFREFVEQHKPELIVIDAGNLLARQFKTDIESVLASNDYCSNVRVLFVDPCVSLLYRNSDDAIREFQSWSVCQRQAVSLGRFVLDPITELSKRWCIDSRTGRNELLSLPLHRNMTDIAPPKLLNDFRKVFMDIVADCGVQINLCSQRDFLSGAIQFVSGLGPRKATNLMFGLKQRGTFCSRAEILRRHVLESCVYRNAIGFLRINHLPPHTLEGEDDDEDEDEDDERDMRQEKHNLLDDTRIHPEDYHWATVVVISAMDIDEESAYSNETLVRLRRAENLNKLEILNLDIFAERIRRRRGQRIVNKLYLIKQEVRCGFKEMRSAFSSPSEDELFHLLAGRTRASLREGMLVNVEIRSITASGIKCKLPSCGLDAWLPAENISKEIRDEFMNIKNAHHQDIQSDACRTERKDLILSFLKQKTHLEARVISIDKGKFNVKLSCLESDIVDARHEHEVAANADAYLVRNHPDDDSRKAVDKARRAAIRNRPLHRNIKYAAFFNISRDDAITKLRQSKGCGQLIFRPSSRGLNYLSMTWKMADNPDIFVHYVIAEKGKPNPYAVGKQLIVGKQVYDDLDEIYTHHKPRLNELSQMMIQHKNFRYGTENDITEMLLDEINVNHKTCYALSYSYRHPGHFLLSYIIHNTKQITSNTKHKVHKEYVGLTYAGYCFRQHYFDDPSKLINWFKANFKRNHPKYSKKNVNVKTTPHKTIKSTPNKPSLNDDHDVHVMHHQHANHHHPHQPPPPYHSNANNGYHHNTNNAYHRY